MQANSTAPRDGRDMQLPADGSAPSWAHPGSATSEHGRSVHVGNTQGGNDWRASPSAANCGRDPEIPHPHDIRGFGTWVSRVGGLYRFDGIDFFGFNLQGLGLNRFSKAAVGRERKQVGGDSSRDDMMGVGLRSAIYGGLALGLIMRCQRRGQWLDEQ